MDSALRHIGDFISKGRDGTAAVYLHALNEHINANTSQRDIIHVLDTVNFLLSKAKTRMLGLEVLDKMLPWVNQDILEQKIQLWTTFILKACNQEELKKYGGLIYKTLTNLAHILRQYTELSKSFASNHLTKIYEVITLSPAAYFTSALKCAEAYLSTYPKPNGQSREAMVRFLKIFPDTFDDQVNHYAGRCFHFLQQTTVPGSKDIKTKEQWKSYQLQLIESLSAILNVANAECNGLGVVDEKTELNVPPLKLSAEPDMRAAQLYVRFHNLSNYLKIAICEPNVACKSFIPKRILNLITQGLVVICATLNQDRTYSKIALGVFLPKIQFDLLELSKALIRALNSHLRIYYKSLLGCLIHVLKSTPSTNRALRAQVYSVINLWCQTLSEGSCCELYADELIPEILQDISPVKNELISQVKTKDKHKKAYTPLNTKECSTKILEKSIQTLYSAPIICLQTIMSSCANFLKPTMITRIQTTVLKICATFFVTKRANAYENWQNRLEMYRLLQTLLLTPNQHSPPPSQIVLHILHAAQLAESNTEIRLTCTKMLQEIEKIVHPQKESLMIPIEGRVIRNAFIKLGQETLLDESHTSISMLRYDCMGIQTVRLAEESSGYAEETTLINEDENHLLEDIEECEEITEVLPIETAEQKVVNVTTNGNNKKKMPLLAEDDYLLKASSAKKQKVEEVERDSAEESMGITDSSSDSDIEIENLQPIATVKQPTRNTTLKDISENKDKKIAANKNDQRVPENATLAKNEEDEIAEMEAFFVDELKGNF